MEPIATYDLSEYDYKIVAHGTKSVIEVSARELSVDEWVNQKKEEFLRDPQTGSGFCGSYTYVFDDNGKTVTARCGYEDKFDRNTGIAIAYARLKGDPVHPDLLPKRKSKAEPMTSWTGPSTAAVPEHTIYYPLTDWYGNEVRNDISHDLFWVRVISDGEVNGLAGAILPVFRGVLSYPYDKYGYRSTRFFDCYGNEVPRKENNDYHDFALSPKMWCSTLLRKTGKDYIPYDPCKF